MVYSGEELSLCSFLEDTDNQKNYGEQLLAVNET